MSNDIQPEIRFPGFTDDWEQRKLGDFNDDYKKKTSVQNQFPIANLISTKRDSFLYFANRLKHSENNIG